MKIAAAASLLDFQTSRAHFEDKITHCVSGAADAGAKLAAERNAHILAASGPVAAVSRPVNRARIFTPTGDIDVQDKKIIARFKRDVWGVIGGGALQIFET